MAFSRLSLVCFECIFCYFFTLALYFSFVFTDLRRNSGAKPASHLFISPNCNFFPVGNLDFVFNPLQPCSKVSRVRNEPLSTVKRSLQLKDTLVQNIVKCRKIQNSFYILMVLKLQLHGVTAVFRFLTDSKCS